MLVKLSTLVHITTIKERIIFIKLFFYSLILELDPSAPLFRVRLLNYADVIILYICRGVILHLQPFYHRHQFQLNISATPFKTSSISGSANAY